MYTQHLAINIQKCNRPNLPINWHVPNTPANQPTNQPTNCIICHIIFQQ